MGNKKILVIDFDDKIINSLCELLQNEGFQIVMAKDGQAGLEEFQTEKPDLVIMEPMLSKLHGFDLCSKISHDSGKKIPVIMITGFYREERYKTEAIRTFGASAFFRKPYKKEELLPAILDLLGEKKEESEEADRGLKAIAGRERETKMRKDKDLGSQFDDELTSLKEDLLKKEKKAAAKHEVDDMLKDRFSDFGLGIDVKKPVAPKKEKIVEPEVKIEKEVKPEEETKIEKEAKPVKEKVEEAKAEKEKKEVVKVKKEPEEKKEAREEKPPQKAEPSPFGKYLDVEEEPAPTLISKEREKKSGSRLIIPIAVVVLVAALIAVYFIAFRKGGSVPREEVSLVLPGVQEPAKTSEEEQAPELVVSEEGTKEGSTVAETTQERTAEQQAGRGTSQAKPESEQAEDTTPPSKTTPPAKKSSLSEELVIPESAPLMEIQTGKKTEAGTEEQKSTAEGSGQPPEKAPGQQPPKEITPAPSKVKAGDIIPLKDVDTPPQIIQRVNPKYPPNALRMGVEAKITVNALISENGDVVKTAIIKGEKGSHGFNEASEKAVMQWKFRPAIKDGVKVKVWRAIAIRFSKNK